MAGAAILSSLALTPSSPIALCNWTERRRSTTLSFDICGRFNVPDTWYGVGGGACLGWQCKSSFSSDWGFMLFCWLRKKLFRVSVISTLFEIVPSLSTSRWRPQSWLSLPDRNLIKFQSFRESYLFSENLLLKYACFVCLIKLVTLFFARLKFSQSLSVPLFFALVRSLSRALICSAMLSLNHLDWDFRFTRLCLSGRNLSVTPSNISYQVSTTSLGSSKTNAESQGASFEAINCSLSMF